MKILTQPANLQPDIDSEDLAPRVCARCGHSEYVHELIAYWHDGECEIHGCGCAAFALFADDEEEN